MGKISIYVVGHKPFVMPEDSDGIYKPVFVGAGKGMAKESGFLTDDIGENISDKNATFCELTAYYWAWKNDKESEIIGFCHYRRYFADKGLLLSPSFIDQAFTENSSGVVLPKKTIWHSDSVLDAYLRGAGYQKDLFEVEEAIRQICPEYLESFYQVLNSKSAYYRNMLIARREVFDAYCAWLFPILFKVSQCVDLTAYNKTEKRVFGFLSEILLNVYLLSADLTPIEVSTSSFNVEPRGAIVRQRFERLGKSLAKRIVWFPTGINPRKWRIC